MKLHRFDKNVNYLVEFLTLLFHVEIVKGIGSEGTP